MKLFFNLLFILNFFSLYSQNNKITIEAKLYPREKKLQLNQQITYYNLSKDTLKEIVLRNWANSYKNDSTPLAKRLLSDYKTDFYFSNKNEKGNSKIHQLKINGKQSRFNHPEQLLDLISINLNQPLQPNDSIEISLNYCLKNDGVSQY